MTTRRNAKSPAAPAKPDFATLLAGAKLPETTVPICLRADLAAEHEQLDRQLQALIVKPSGKLGGDGRGELRQRIEALEAEMAEGTQVFRLRARPRVQWRAFVAEHPPRQTADGELDERDRSLGVNAETFFEALIKISTVDPDMGVDVDAYFKALLESRAADAPSPVLADGLWPQLFDALTDRQFSNLADAAWALNRRDVDVPFSRAALLLSRSSEAE